MFLFEVDASKVVAGWLPLGLILLLGVAIVLLYLNMRRHLRRGNDLPTEAEVQESARAAREGEVADSSAVPPTGRAAGKA